MDLCWGGSSIPCGEVTDDACSVASEVIGEQFGCRRVSFVPGLVSNVKVCPRLRHDEKVSLFYTDQEICYFRQEARREKRERLMRMRSAPALIESDY